MKTDRLFAVVLGLGFFLSACAAQTPKKVSGDAKAPPEPVFLEEDMDFTIRPGDDFFRWVNGGWIERTEIPADKTSYAAFDIVREKTDEKVKALLEKLSSDASSEEGTLAKKIGDFYAMGMDLESAEKAGLEPIREELDRIDGLKTKEDVQDLVSHLHTLGINPLFAGTVYQDFKDPTVYKFYFFQDGLGMPDRDYYFNEDERSVKLRTEYLKHLEKMFTLLGDSQEKAAKNAGIVMEIETKLAEKSWTKTELRNIPAMYNKMTITELQERVGAIDWNRYFAKISDTTPDPIIVGMPEFMDRVGELIGQVPVESWQVYLRWNLINKTAPFLSSDFVMQDYHFYKEVMAGAEEIEPRWRRVVKATNATMGEPVGKLYVEAYFPASSKERMIELVEYLRKAFAKRIENNPWMGDKTRAEALAKLEKMRPFIGYPDKWEDYSGLEIKRDSYAKNVLRAQKFDYYKTFNKLNEPVDPDEWDDIDPHTVNAGYNPLRNIIIFPAGILQPPFFYPDGDDAINYGAIGMAIGHEMTHGFDDMGRRFDKTGNMRDWWTAEDAKKFGDLTQLLVEHYNGFSVLGKTNVNGELSLGENIADLGGLTISFDAYRMAQEGRENPPLEGFTPEQRFFMSFAKVWRGRIRDEALLARTQEDVHPWGEYRVNGAPFNMSEFYEIFEIEEKDALYRPPEKRPVIW